MRTLSVFSLVVVIALTFITSTFYFFQPKAAYTAEQTASPKEVKKVNINTASIEELGTIKGIGEKTAKAIVDFRTKNGSFKTIEDLKKVKGIGDKKFEAIKNGICVN